MGPGGQRDQEHGVVLHVQGEGYQPPITSKSQGHGVVLHVQGKGYQI